MVDNLKTLSPGPSSSSFRIKNGRGAMRLRLKLSALVLLAGILVGSAIPGASAYAAPAASAPAASAASVIGKNVQLNGTPMSPGSTLFPGDLVRLGEASSVALQFGNSLVLAAAETELVVESGGVNLRNGFLQVRAGGADSLAVFRTVFPCQRRRVRRCPQLGGDSSRRHAGASFRRGRRR